MGNVSNTLVVSALCMCVQIIVRTRQEKLLVMQNYSCIAISPDCHFIRGVTKRQMKPHIFVTFVLICKIY